MPKRAKDKDRTAVMKGNDGLWVMGD